ncbi:MAG TPA: type VI secretion system ATPase TssH, partial [Firmicutes bacterium]|nr:type VI secretion system ATPase TssH [Bacillota bacterium]
MDLNRYTNKVREAIATAQSGAARYHHQQIDCEHLFLALLQQENGMAPRILSRTGADSAAIRNELESFLSRQPKVYAGEGTSEQIYLSPRLARVLEQAKKEAASFKDEYISVEHLLLALLETDKGEAAHILQRAGLNRSKLLRVLQGIRGNQRITSEDPEATFEALTKYGRDLTEMAANGKLDPVIGRDEEI